MYTAMAYFAAALFTGYLICFCWDYPQARYFFGIWLVINIIVRILFKNQAGLMRERGKPGPGIPAWDKFLVVLFRILNGAVLVTALLDAGYYHLSPDFPLPAYIVGYLMLLGGTGFSLWAMHSNPFFSSMVRIQNERNHRLVSNGPYQWLRHPGYSGSLLTTLAVPVVLGSLWAMIPAVLVMAVVFVRTYKEDVYLQEKLPGYKEYARRVPCRLLPKMW